jgi:threonine dehydrogenase-like Zn-dependent dehydrogenase
LTLGHEATGVVYKVGSQVKIFKPGDRVAVGAITPDWGDIASQGGHPSQSGQPLGGWKFSNTKDGVFTEYFHVNEADANMAKIPDDVSDEAAVYVADMMSTGFAGAEEANIPIGGSAVVFALGPVGLMAVAGAKFRGAGLIVGVDSVPKRQELAKFYGADLTIDPTKEDAVSKIMDLTGGLGADARLKRLGQISHLRTHIKVTKPGGTISHVGYHGVGECVCIPRLD